MKVLQVLGLILGLAVLAEAQACGYTFLTIYLTDANGQLIKNAEINTYDEDFKNRYFLYPKDDKSIDPLEKRMAWSEKRQAYFGSEGMCGGHRDVGFRISAKDFETFDQLIDLPLGWTSYSIKLKRKNSVEAAQSEKLTHFRGWVYDVNKAVIPAAALEITDEKGKTYFTESNENGIFDVDLPVGNYTVKVSKMGFRTQKIINFRIEDTNMIFLDLTLKVRSCDDCKNLWEEIDGKDTKEEILDYQILKRKNNK